MKAASPTPVSGSSCSVNNTFYFYTTSVKLLNELYMYKEIDHKNVSLYLVKKCLVHFILIKNLLIFTNF